VPCNLYVQTLLPFNLYVRPLCQPLCPFDLCIPLTFVCPATFVCRHCCPSTCTCDRCVHLCVNLCVPFSLCVPFNLCVQILLPFNPYVVWHFHHCSLFFTKALSLVSITACLLRETSLLVDPHVVPLDVQQDLSVAATVSHEILHQWFGWVLFGCVWWYGFESTVRYYLLKVVLIRWIGYYKYPSFRICRFDTCQAAFWSNAYKSCKLFLTSWRVLPWWPSFCICKFNMFQTAFLSNVCKSCKLFLTSGEFRLGAQAFALGKLND